MKRKILHTIILALLSVTFFQCNNNSITNTVKFHPDDPFKNTIVPSQTFVIDSKKDNIIEGEKGTVVVCPEGCFTDSKGEIVADNVTVELSEALSLNDMVLSNLTTTSDGNLLETDGMIYFNATANGKQLFINKENPIHIEIPAAGKEAGMMAYRGIRDEKGNMNWIEPKALDNYLITIDINSLDFLPQGFQVEVENGMPYKMYKTATKELTDSLYYSLSVTDGRILVQDLIPVNYNEPYYNKGKQVVNGKYTSGSYLEDKSLVESDSLSSVSCGIDPAMIKVIRSEKFQNTFIATREFETRLKVIFKTCNNQVLTVYINNLDKNLYEADSMAAIAVGESQYHDDFINFSRQRLTKVKQAGKYADLLKGYYEKQLAKVRSELEKRQEKLMKELREKNDEAEKTAKEYKKLLGKRERYRMETYGFDWTETGWINVDRGTITKEWDKQPLQIVVDNGAQFDRVYTYVVYTSINSLYRLNTDDNAHFYAGNDEDRQMLMPKKKPAIAIAIGYKDEVPALSVREFETGTELKFSLTLTASNIENLKEAIRPYEKYSKENRISKDLEFMAKFYREEQRQKELKSESEFISRLWNIAIPCCVKKKRLNISTK